MGNRFIFAMGTVAVIVTIAISITNHKDQTKHPPAPAATPTAAAPTTTGDARVADHEPPTPSPIPHTTTRDSTPGTVSVPPAGDAGTPAHYEGRNGLAPAAATAVAQRFCQAFLDTSGKTSKEWARGVARYVTSDLTRNLASVDVANLSNGQVRRAEVTSSSPVAATVIVDTTDGPMSVLVTWSGDRWEVSRYLPAKHG